MSNLQSVYICFGSEGANEVIVSNDIHAPGTVVIISLFLLTLLLSKPELGCRTGSLLADENEASSHDLALMLSREDSFIERGIKETLESAHARHTESSPIFRIVALQNHDSQSTKCKLEVLLSTIKFSIMWLFVRILL